METRKLIELKYPIIVKTAVKDEKGNQSMMETSITALSLGRIKAKHLKLIPQIVFESAASGSSKNIEPSALIPLIAGIADLPVTTIEELDFADLISVVEEVVKLVESSASQ